TFTPRNGLGQGLRRLTKSSAFQKLQIKVLRQNITKAQKLAHRHGIKSAAGVAITADLANQWGEQGATRWLSHQSGTSNEAARLHSIVSAVNSASQYGARYRSDLQKAVANELSFTQPMQQCY